MNAVILAAGLGSRFKDMTKNTPKAFLPIDGRPNLERNIEYLIDSGIDEIIIVVGYLKEKFYYLEDKYKEVKLIENPKYKTYNNMYSFYLAKEYLGDSLILESDIVILKNIFDKVDYDYSTYFTVNRKIDGVEWVPVISEDGFVVDMDITDKKLPSLAGISYWKKEDIKKIIMKSEEYYKNNKFSDSKLYWDNFIIDLYGELKIKCREISSNLIFEMDNKEDYDYINKIIKEEKFDL